MRNLEIVVDQCLARRISPHHGEARRLFHGRGQRYPGFEDLVVDQFGAYLLVGCFGDHVEDANVLGQLLGERLDGIAGVGVQHRRGRKTEVRIVQGEMPDQLEVGERDLKFLIRPLANQNIGLFLDMAPTRAWVQANAEGKKVLNLFSFTCSFSVAAIAGGAVHVVNNDMSRPALDWGRANHHLNDQDRRSVTMLPHNLFKSWWKIRQLGPYSMVIIDPPTNQRGSFNAEKQYSQVMKKLAELCLPGADVIACLNSPFLNSDFLNEQMARWCPRARLVEELPASDDFPDKFPDRGLKIIRFRLP